MRGYFCRYFILLLLGCCAIQKTSATHLRAAEIKVERLNCADLTFQITLIVYVDTKSTTLVGGFSLNDGGIYFGDGSSVIIPHIIPVPRPDLGPDIAIATFTVVHTFLAPGIYEINYREGDRSAGVLNMTDSEDARYSSSTTINTNVEAGCNTFPALAIPPVDLACTGITFFHTAGAFDADGDSLSYELTIPEQNINVPVDGYIELDDPVFYINYNQANELGTGPPSFSINPTTGLITWDAPGMQGEYSIAFAIIEWRRNVATGELIKLSTTIRDMQIIVEECENLRPDVLIPVDICIEAGTLIQSTIFGVDPEFDSVKIESFSEIFNLASNPATVVPATAVFTPSQPSSSLEFSWQTECLHVREQPYQVVFKITDKPSPGVALTTFKTWNIKVIAPAPTWNSAEIDAGDRSAVLEWDDYSCQNADAIQIWRSVEEIQYNPSVCETGIPSFLGYELIATVGQGQPKFIDTNNGAGLAVGASHCYRLVAVYNLPAGGKSTASSEICIGPIKADAPIITHVTVEKTDDQDGITRVSWRSPIAIDAVLFPRPYQYEVYRADGFSGKVNLTKISDLIADTTFLDTGINTALQPHNYRVVIFAKPFGLPEYLAFDTSSVASSVWLGAEPGDLKIALDWSAIVPWSNSVQGSPWHLVYRGTGETGMVLIDSVDVRQQGYAYVDEGNYMNTPLIENELYCYQIKTRGSYGDTLIGILENLSQQACTYPTGIPPVDLVPCQPQVTITLTDCEQFIGAETCDLADFSNHISWQPNVGDGCRVDIVSYNVYAADALSDDFVLLATDVRDVVFEETNLSSYARCYRVEAVDASGNVSELSEPVCNDNCPYYDLPNVITPNGDGCNDRFSAYRADDAATCSSDNISHCPQFVEKVTFKVFNRWGKSIYDFESGNGNSINIDWDGRDNDGSLLDAAVYYYLANVTFNTVDPEKQKQVIRGWVQVIR